jgi:hypothetical protein
MAIVNAGFSAESKVQSLKQSPQNFQFCVSIEIKDFFPIYFSDHQSYE